MDRGGSDGGHAVRELARLEIDVLCLQEATTASMLTLFGRGIAESRWHSWEMRMRTWGY